jgi:cystathionine beta-lyase/cystathionine gamma-synthase
VFQHPLVLGADLSLYSATKYLSGNSDLIAGVALSGDLVRKIRAKRGLFGNILQPDECWMLDSRLPTVTLRMNRQSKSAQRIAETLVRNRGGDLTRDVLGEEGLAPAALRVRIREAEEEGFEPPSELPR